MPRRDVPWPRGLADRLCFGGDYNPEQWPESVWAEDVALMREAGVNLVSVGWIEVEKALGTFIKSLAKEQHLLLKNAKPGRRLPPADSCPHAHGA